MEYFEYFKTNLLYKSELIKSTWVRVRDEGKDIVWVRV